MGTVGSAVGGSVHTRSWSVEERRKEFRERMASVDANAISPDVVRVKVEVERIERED